MFGFGKNKDKKEKKEEILIDVDLQKTKTAEKTKKDTSAVHEKEIQPKRDTLMGSILDRTPNPPAVGDLVEGLVINIEKGAVYVDLPPFGTGIIYGREYINAKDIIKKVNIGDNVAGKVVSLANKDGYIEISLKEARQALIWGEAENAIRDKTTLELVVSEANKGGLILSWQGIQGFLPASQLKTEHYPRVSDGDKDKILEELKKFVGQKMFVSIIAAIPKEGKLIFSEKNPEQKNKDSMVEKYVVGDVLSGEVTGVVDFGVFVRVEDGLEGLVHISEIDWGLVENPRNHFKTGDKVKVKIIEIKEGKISLSIKALKENPWIEAAKKYKKDKEVQAVIIKYNKHGALGSIEEGVAGLVHVSEFGSESSLRETLELGKSYPFKITLFEPKEQKMTLSYLGTR